MVNKPALRDVLKKMSDRETVLYDILTSLHILQSHLMSGRDF